MSVLAADAWFPVKGSGMPISKTYFCFKYSYSQIRVPGWKLTGFILHSRLVRRMPTSLCVGVCAGLPAEVYHLKGSKYEYRYIYEYSYMCRHNMWKEKKGIMTHPGEGGTAMLDYSTTTSSGGMTVTHFLL